MAVAVTAVNLRGVGRTTLATRVLVLVTLAALGLVLGLAGCLLLALSLPWASVLAGLGVLACGAAWYALRHRAGAAQLWPALGSTGRWAQPGSLTPDRPCAREGRPCPRQGRLSAPAGLRAGEREAGPDRRVPLVRVPGPKPRAAAR